MTTADTTEAKPVLWTSRKPFLFGMLVVSLGAVIAFVVSDFVPSQPAMMLGGIGIGVGAALGGGLALLPGFRDRLSGRAFFLRPLWVRVPMFALLFSYLGFAGFATGYPALYTSAFGVEGSEQVEVSSWHSPTRKGHCGGPDIAGRPMIFTVCMNGAKLPKGTKIVLHGKQTALGINADSVTVDSNP